MRSLLIFMFVLNGCSSVVSDYIVDAEAERNYEAFMVTPNIPEICRAASRPEDAFIDYSELRSKKRGTKGAK